MYFLWLFLVLALSGSVGFALFHRLFSNPVMGGAGFLAGVVIGLIFDATSRRLKKLPARVLLGAVAGLFAGLLVMAVAVSAVPRSVREFPAFIFVQFFAGLGLAYCGVILGARKGEEFSLEDVAEPFRKKSSGGSNDKILDTSVIIDGRIADICDTGFIEGTFIVPQFVLRELQYIADSPDSLKRNRGRRGLDILQAMQKKPNLTVNISDQDFPKIREVDAKLIELARKLNGKIITNDFNLNKVAELNGVPVLNINLLTNALKPVVLPGELMNVHILREGKEANQGVAYLDDGTMVVVDNARRFIGRHVEVSVTSVLQTTAGRMIFTQMKENSAFEASVPDPRPGGSGS
jgi:uncharacterized protein YacL